MKNVQIPYDLFVALVEYHLGYDDEYEDEIRQGLEQKLDALVRHELYAKYKTAPSPEEREQARQAAFQVHGVRGVAPAVIQVVQQAQLLHPGQGRFDGLLPVPPQQLLPQGPGGLLRRGEVIQRTLPRAAPLILPPQRFQLLGRQLCPRLQARRCKEGIPMHRERKFPVDHQGIAALFGGFDPGNPHPASFLSFNNLV